MFFSSFIEVVGDGSHSVESGIALESLGMAIFRRIDRARRGVWVVVKTLPPPLRRDVVIGEEGGCGTGFRREDTGIHPRAHVPRKWLCISIGEKKN